MADSSLSPYLVHLNLSWRVQPVGRRRPFFRVAVRADGPDPGDDIPQFVVGGSAANGILQAKTLADGGLFQILSTQFVGTPLTTNTYNETVGDTTFTIQADITAGSGPVGSNSTPLDIVVTF